MDPQQSVDVADSGGLDQAGGGDPNRMQATLDLPLPEIQELVQDGIPWGDIEILPDKCLKHIRMVRQVVQDLGGGQAIILQLPNKAHVFQRPFQARVPGQSLRELRRYRPVDNMMSDKVGDMQPETQ